MTIYTSQNSSNDQRQEKTHVYATSTAGDEQQCEKLLMQSEKAAEKSHHHKGLQQQHYYTVLISETSKPAASAVRFDIRVIAALISLLVIVLVGLSVFSTIALRLYYHHGLISGNRTGLASDHYSYHISQGKDIDLSQKGIKYTPVRDWILTTTTTPIKTQLSQLSTTSQRTTSTQSLNTPHRQNLLLTTPTPTSSPTHVTERSETERTNSPLTSATVTVTTEKFMPTVQPHNKLASSLSTHTTHILRTEKTTTNSVSDITFQSKLVSTTPHTDEEEEEKKKLPQESETFAAARFSHDFRRKLSVIVDDRDQRCYILSMKSAEESDSVIDVPEKAADLLTLILRTGDQVINSQSLRADYRVKGEELPQPIITEQYGSYTAELCSPYPIYRLERA